MASQQSIPFNASCFFLWWLLVASHVSAESQSSPQVPLSPSLPSTTTEDSIVLPEMVPHADGRQPEETGMETVSGVEQGARGGEEKAASNGRPHIVLILADDHGWANVGYHNSGNAEVVTPNIDHLAATGIELDRHYAYKICSPSRSALQSGRLPVHVNFNNVEPESYNPKDSVSGYQGIPRNMTCMANKLSAAGYKCHAVGKWDAGMATPRHTPIGRGYESWLGYFHHTNDYYTQQMNEKDDGQTNLCGASTGFVDLWDTSGPATGRNGTAYEEDMFNDRSISIIDNHDPSSPLFLFHSFHLNHMPLEVPPEYLARVPGGNRSKLGVGVDTCFPCFHNSVCGRCHSCVNKTKDDGPLCAWCYHVWKGINLACLPMCEDCWSDPDANRRIYAAMSIVMDDVVGNITQALQRKGMLQDTLIVFLADNGGPIYQPAAGNNYPLRGGKYSDWEGGIRTNAIVSGGYIPEALRGTRSTALVSIADWYATFAGIAGIDPHDEEAEQVGLPPIDGVNVWPYLSKANATVPRDEIHVSPECLIQGRFKLLKGTQSQSIWTGPLYPNSTGKRPSWPGPEGNIPVYPVRCRDHGCLYDIFADEGEHVDLAHDHANDALRNRMIARLNQLNEGNFKPDRGEPSTKACEWARNYGGFYGPFLEVGEEHA